MGDIIAAAGLNQKRKQGGVLGLAWVLEVEMAIKQPGVKIDINLVKTDLQPWPFVLFLISPAVSHEIRAEPCEFLQYIAQAAPFRFSVREDDLFTV